MSWTDDVRIIGGRTATFTGATSQSAGVSGLALDTTKSFSIAAWTRLTDLTTTSTLLAKDAASGQSSPFRLRARPLASGGNAWCLSMVAAATATSGTEVCSTVANTANQWVHVAAGFDRAEGRIKVWVNGLETSAAFTAPITNGRGIVVGQGVDAVAGPGDRLRGNVADLQVFDRLLVAEDFTGHTAGATLDGDVDVPGILDPIEVGWWTFSRGFNCRDETNQATCLASADDPFGRQLRTTLGTEIKTGGHDGRAMFLDDLLVDGEAPNSKPEYGQSQRNTGTADVPAWAYAPVLRTDQSFSVSAWVNPDDFGTGAHTIVSQDGPDRTPFGLSLRPATVAGVTADRWTFSMVPSSGTGGDVVISAEPVDYEDTAVWTHVVGVYDAVRKEARLYVNGVPEKPLTKNFPVWQASGPLTVGGALFSGVRTDRWRGGIDDVHAYQARSAISRFVTCSRANCGSR